MSLLVRVRFADGARTDAGQYAPGEEAAFSPERAAELVRVIRGAEIVSTQDTSASPPVQKAPSSPEVHKQIKSPEKKKGEA